MKKLGFTLSEVIIALGIVAVISAISAPLIGGLIPDRKKVEVLKFYKALNDINQEALEDMGLYMNNAEQKGLCNTRVPNNSPGGVRNNWVANEKYLRLLFDKFETGRVPPANGEFITKDGVAVLSVDFVNNANGNDPYACQATITIDLNDADPPNAVYPARNYDRFIFIVNGHGRVSGGDGMTSAYLANPHRMSDRRADTESADGFNRQIMNRAGN